jgi:hypothetical protein
MRPRSPGARAQSALGVRMVALATVALATGIEAAAQVQPGAAEPDVPEKAGKELVAFRVISAPPNIDGVLDDPVWLSTRAIEDFVQGEPDNMTAPTERTAVQVAYDDSYLYVAVRAYEEDASLVAAGLGRRDNFPPSDRVSLWTRGTITSPATSFR